MTAFRLFRPDEDGPQAQAPAPTVADIAAHWRRVEESKYDLRAFIERWRQIERFLAVFGQRMADSMLPAEVVDWILAQPGWKSPSTRAGAARNLMHVFNLARRHKLIAANPIEAVREDFREGEGRRPVTWDECRALLRHATDQRFRLFVIALWLTGMRPGELASLRWPDVVLADGMIVLERHKTRKKTKRPRIVPLEGPSIKLLAYLHARRTDDGFVFRNQAGTAWNAQSLANRLSRLRIKSGVPKDCYFHGCRHAWGTSRIAAGVPIKIVSEAMGHSSVVTTEKRYCHLGGRVAEMRAALEKARGPHV